MDEVLQSVHNHLLPVFTIAVIVLGGSFGLWFTPLSKLSTFAIPIAAGVVATSLFGLIAVPFFPLVIGGVLALFLLLFAYEWYVNKTFAGAVKGTENALGVSKTASAPMSSTGPVQVQLNHA